MHIFYKELSTDESNIFTVDLAEKNKVENVKFKKSQSDPQYAVTGPSINHDIGSVLVAVTDVDRQNLLRNAILKLLKEKKILI